MAKNPYGYPEFISSTGYGTGAGLKGWNCYHDFHPFIPGVDEPNYTEEEVAQMNAEDNVPRKYGDKEYTAYEATQRQRELERVMRKYGEESHLLELGGADEDTVLATKVRYQTASQEYAAFSKAMGLPQQRERIRNGMESLAQYAQTGQGAGNPVVMTIEQAHELEAKHGLTYDLKPAIMKNIELPLETDQVRSMSAETKQLISDAFDKILAQYDVRVDEIVTEPLTVQEKAVPFQFQPIRGKNGELIKRIVINSQYDFMGSQKEMQARIMRNFNNGVLASNSIEGLIAHELAHVMTFQDIYSYSGYLIENKSLTKQFVSGISLYADSKYDGSECIAEAFAAKICGQPISQEAQKLLDEFIERRRKHG